MTEPTGTAPQGSSDATGRDSLGRDVRPWLGPVRLGIGLLQGLGLFWLHRASDDGVSWPATQPLLFGPLLLVVAFLPVVLLAGVGRLRPPTLAIWAVVAGVALALLGLHDIARQSAETLQHPPFLTPPAILFSAAALFIAHHLIVPADMERRRIAGYPAYFDTATKALVQLALSIGFTGALWILLHLGAALFRIIGLDFLEDLLRKDWFFVPATTLAFSVAVHLTDVRDGLIRGVRTVGLMLLSWLLLVMTVLVAGFVAALPFTGLQGLWETGSATALVLAAAAALIVLINAAYQDGRTDNRPPVVLRAAVRVAAVLIAPLIVIAFWGLALRIGQHGLTPDRIIAAACALVGAVFAVGYGWAALSPFWRKGDWMRPLERTTVGAAVLALILILALFSPLADPARLSVADQMARLERGAVAPDKFDYRFLRFESGKAGQAALARLARSPDARVARLATAMQAEKQRYDINLIEPVPSADDIRIRANPAGARLPVSFTEQYPRLREVLSGCIQGAGCEARLLDLDRDGETEVVVAARRAISVFKREEDGRWFEWAEYRPPACQEGSIDVAGALRGGQFETAQPAFPDLVLNGTRFRRQEGSPECDRETSEAATRREAPRAPLSVENHGPVSASAFPP